MSETVDAKFILEQVAAGKWGWLKINRFKPEDHSNLEERYAALEKHHAEETQRLIVLLLGLCEQHHALRSAVQMVVTQRGDDLCWRDVYTQLAKMVGIDFCPELIEGKEKMLENCRCFLDSLYGGEYKPVYVERKP